MSDKRDDFGDRMKAYEAVESQRKLEDWLPTYVRLDGRGFSKFTKGMRRPYDVGMSWAMKVTAEEIQKQFKPMIVFTQSDEISIGFRGVPNFPHFSGRIQKLTSVLASVATARFNKAMHQLGGDYEARAKRMLPSFDARIMQVPDHDELVNAFKWRELDAGKNAVQMAARANYSHKSLHGKDQQDMRAMLLERGIDYDTYYPEFFRCGIYLKKVMREVPIEAEMKLNPKFVAVNDTVMRSRIVRLRDYQWRAPHKDRVDFWTRTEGLWGLLTPSQQERALNMPDDIDDSFGPPSAKAR